MGEALLKRHAAVRGIGEQYLIHSAGTGVYGPTIDGVFRGYPASDRSEIVMRSRGITLQGHLSKRMVPEMLGSSDLVLAMAREHLRDAIHLQPEVADRAFLLKEAIELVRQAPLIGDFNEVVAELNARRSSPWDAVALGWDADVEDPVGGDVEEFEICAIEIESLIDELAEAIWPTESPVDLVRGGGEGLTEEQR